MSAEILSLHDARIRREARDIIAASPFRPGVEYLTATELSRKIQRSVKSIGRDRKAGMPAYPMGSGYRYSLEEVIDWHARRESA